MNCNISSMRGVKKSFMKTDKLKSLKQTVSEVTTTATIVKE